MKACAACLLSLLLTVPASPVLAGGFVDIASEGRILDRWQPDGQLPLPQAPPGLADAGEDVCVNIGYLVDSEGRTSNYVLLKAWGERTGVDREGRERLGRYAQMAALALSDWRFAPSLDRGGRRLPVYTAQTFAFSAEPGAHRRELRARCSVGDLRDFIDRAFAKAQARGNIMRGLIERKYADPPSLDIGHHPPQRR
jgi:hypothetical protein